MKIYLGKNTSAIKIDVTKNLQNNSMQKNIILIIISLILTLTAMQAQRDWDSHNRERAKVQYDNAYNAYRNGNSDVSLKYIERAIELHPRYAEAWMQKAIIYEDRKIYDSAILFYHNALDINPDVFPNAWYTVGMLEYTMGRYEEADKDLTTFLEHPKATSVKVREKAELLHLKNKEALRLRQETVPFEPFNLGDSVNSQYDEYFPVLTLDGKSLIMTRLHQRQEPVSHWEEDFFISTRDSFGAWTKAVRMPEPINSNRNEGAMSLSADGRYLFFAMGEERRELGHGSFDIWVSRFINGAWAKPFNIGKPVNTEHWESQPSFSSDGRTLYFASNRPGGYGQADIWKSMLNDDGFWSEPENLGPEINTSGMEASPFIHPDQKTLYFSSNGHPGFGGMDLFVARIGANGRFERPVNLGFPINTHADERTLSVNRTGDTAYFASDKYNGFGGSDIYAFALYEQARPQTVSFMRGRVLDADTKEPLEARFELINLETGEQKVQSYSDRKSGKFIVALPINEQYALNVSKDAYLFYSEHIALDESHAVKPMEKDVLLSKIVAGEKLVLNNIFFAVDKADLRSESYPELEKLYQLLRRNSLMRIEVSGHTDNTGSVAHNQTLSEQRAAAIVKYLVDKGIAAERLVSVGYGSSKPIASNDTEEGRALNRRTEVQILQ